jgi:septal ring factor EnvC (AmiA/AmiB activator)
MTGISDQHWFITAARSVGFPTFIVLLVGGAVFYAKLDQAVVAASAESAELSQELRHQTTEIKRELKEIREDTNAVLRAVDVITTRMQAIDRDIDRNAKNLERMDRLRSYEEFRKRSIKRQDDEDEQRSLP